MKITRCFKLLAFSALAFSGSSIVFSETFASQYNNAYRENYGEYSRDVYVEHTGLSKSMGFFDEAQPKARPYDGVAETRIEQRRKVKNRQNAAQSSGKTYRDGSIFGGTCCTEGNKSCSEEDMKGCVGVSPAPKMQPCINKEACRPKRQRPEVVVETTTPMRDNFVNNYATVGKRGVYNNIHTQCSLFAPLQLEWVDFRLNGNEDINGSFAQKLGNYRFRIFGCRRYNKEAFLDQGRVLQKEMRFMRIFEDELKDCFKIIKVPADVCTEQNPSPLPEYTLTAEITNYFMNVCDKYNWDESIKEETRMGSSEITIKWTLTDINKQQVYWSGESTGYGELLKGEENGEITLVEKAYADSVNKLRNLPGFQKQLTRRFTPAEKANQRIALIEHERETNPIKCQYTKHETEENQITQYVYTPESEKITITETKTTVIEKTPASSVFVKEEPKVPASVTETIAENSEIKTTVSKISDTGGTIDTATLLEKERPSEALDVSILSTPASERYGKSILEDREEIKVDLPVTPIEKPCENSTLFGKDCDCNNKLYRGCEDNKIYRGCEDNQDYKGCEKQPPFGNCVEDAKGCKVENNVDLGVEEKGGVVATGTVTKQTWINVPVKDKGAIDAQNSLCVVERIPYDVPLSPEDIYRIRASIISITNNQGKKGAGLIVSDQFVITSADLITKENNSYDLETINGVKFKGQAVRINPDKNTALLFLDNKTLYTPLSLNLDLPKINNDTYLTLGLMDFDSGEGYLEDSGKVSGYRYSKERETEIMVDTFVQNVTIGGALIDRRGTITGIAHTGRQEKNQTDLFLPVTTALKSVGLEICGKKLTDIPVKNNEVSEAILFNSGSKEPLPMSKTERK